MKKAISILLVLVLLVSLSACDTRNEKTDRDDSDETVVVDSRPSIDAEDKEGEEDENKQSTLLKPREFNKRATIEKTVLVDEYDVKITATKLTYNNYEAVLHLAIENNSDKDLKFITHSWGYSCNSINGYMITDGYDGYLNCDVSAGKKASDSVSFSYETLMMYGIFEIADIEIGFNISDDDYTDIYTGPRVVRTTVAEQYDYKIPYYRENIASKEAQDEYDYSVPYFSDEAIYDESDLVIASQTVVENKEGERTLLLEVVNNSKATVRASTTNIDINGLRVCSSTWSSDAIIPGKTAIVDIDLSSVFEPEYWDVYGITEIGDIELEVSFKDTDNNVVANPADISVLIPGADATFSKKGIEIYNKNGICLIVKGIYASMSSYSDDMFIYMVAENTSGKTLSLQNVYNSLSVNDYMVDYSFYGVTIEEGTSAMMEIRLWGDGLEDIDITEPAEITAVEFSLSIRDKDYREIDEAKITFANE